MTEADAVRCLRHVALPAGIVGVLRTLQDAGHAAALVGGAVRDVLLGATDRGDWDVTTSAHPHEVQTLFPKTVPTGIDHGTITVLTGHRSPLQPVEVTTFRGESEYRDGRRPSEVHFHRDLERDLARRDFTVNAFAWDPIRAEFTDCFDGLGDLHRRLIRAVGDPLERFREDGLRTMRAVRFCATLEFGLERATEAAIPRALDVFDRVSAERIHTELWKLLGARHPSLGLWPMSRTGMWDHVLPPLQMHELQAAIESVDSMPPDPVIRLARLLRPAGQAGANAQVGRAIDGLRPSREQRRRLSILSGSAVTALEHVSEPVAIRQAAAALGREHLWDALWVVGADDNRREQVLEACRDVPLSIKELDVSGKDLIAAGIVEPGPRLGDVLKRLLEAVLERPERNVRATLLSLARQWAG